LSLGSSPAICQIAAIGMEKCHYSNENQNQNNASTADEIA